MTDAPKLLTEAEWRERIAEWGAIEHGHLILSDLNERGMIAPEPVDPLLIEAREICARAIEEVRADGQLHWVDPEAYRSGKSDGNAGMKAALAALKRGMELRPELTREMVREAAEVTVPRFFTDRQIDRLHAALTKGTDHA